MTLLLVLYCFAPLATGPVSSNSSAGDTSQSAVHGFVVEENHFLALPSRLSRQACAISSSCRAFAR